MRVRIPNWLAERLGKNDPVIELGFPDLFGDMPDSLKQFLIFTLLFLIGGILILFIAAALTMY